MNGLCTKNRVNLDQVLAVPVPQHTRSWKPVPYGDAIGFLKTNQAIISMIEMLINGAQK